MIAYQTSSVSTTREQGLYVAAVSCSSGFQVGDRIVAVNDVEVSTCGQIREILGGCRPGDVAGVTVLRGGTPVGIAVTLTEADLPLGGVEPAA